jgi:septum site-determining protein MinC
MEESSDPIHIKGTRDGLLVTVAAGAWEELSGALLEQIDARREFFRGARLALDVGGHSLKVHDMVPLRDRLSDRGLALWAVVSESEVTQNTAQLLGLATRISKPRPEEGRQFALDDLGEETALFLNRTLRSGTRIEFEGHVVIVGDVNAGAEVIAAGNVLVWGRARGLLHAGFSANRKAVICGLDLTAAQLRIAGEAAGEDARPSAAGPETVAFGQDGRLHSQSWQST